MRIITPAEKPIIREINLGLGSFTKNEITQPIVVESPASNVKRRAKIMISSIEDLDNNEKTLIKVINFDEYMQFLNLDKKGESLSKREKKILSTLKKTIKLSIEAIKSSSALKKLTRLSEKCYKLLYY